MLRKLASIARELDLIGDYQGANIITEIMKKYAQSALDDDNLAEFPPAPKGLQEWPHFQGTDDVDMSSMDDSFMNHYRGMEDLYGILSGGKSTAKKFPSKWIGRKRVTLPYGTASKLNARHRRRLRYTPESLEENANNMRNYYNERTHNGTKPRVFDVHYESTNDPKSTEWNLDSPEGLNEFRDHSSRVRRLLTVPEVQVLMRDLGMIDDATQYLPFVDYDSVQALFNKESKEYNSPWGEAFRSQVKEGSEKEVEKKMSEGATEAEIRGAKAKYILESLCRKIDPEAITHLQQAISTRDELGKFAPHFGKQGWDEFIDNF